MSKDTATTRRGIGVEEHAWPPELRRALLRWGGDATANEMSSRGRQTCRLLDVGAERLARINASGVDTEVLRIARPGGQRRTGVRSRLNRFAAFATLPRSGNRASGHRPGTSGQCSSRTGETFLDRASFERVVEAAAHLGVPLYIHAATPSRRLVDAAYSGFGEMTGGDSAPDRRRDAGLGRDARPLRRPCRSAGRARPRLRRPRPARRVGPGQARQPQRRTSPCPLPPERQTHA